MSKKSNAASDKSLRTWIFRIFALACALPGLIVMSFFSPITWQYPLMLWVFSIFISFGAGGYSLLDKFLPYLNNQLTIKVTLLATLCLLIITYM